MNKKAPNRMYERNRYADMSAFQARNCGDGSSFTPVVVCHPELASGDSRIAQSWQPEPDVITDFDFIAIQRQFDRR